MSKKIPEIMLSEINSFSDCRCKAITLELPTGTFSQQKHLMFESIKLSVVDVRKSVKKTPKTETCPSCKSRSKLNFVFKKKSLVVSE